MPVHRYDNIAGGFIFLFILCLLYIFLLIFDILKIFCIEHFLLSQSENRPTVVILKEIAHEIKRCLFKHHLLKV